MPLALPRQEEHKDKKRQKTKQHETHDKKSGERTKFFEDDGEMSLTDMVAHEKRSRGQKGDSEFLFNKFAAQSDVNLKMDEEYDMDEMMVLLRHHLPL